MMALMPGVEMFQQSVMHSFFMLAGNRVKHSPVTRTFLLISRDSKLGELVSSVSNTCSLTSLSTSMTCCNDAPLEYEMKRNTSSINPCELEKSMCSNCFGHWSLKNCHTPLSNMECIKLIVV